jgi:hypothetical protein
MGFNKAESSTGETKPVAITKIGADLVFGRLWESAGLKQIVSELVAQRRHEFDLERCVYLTVLHRLFASGSDRAAELWKQNCRIAGAEKIELHHLYRAMAWLGEPLEHTILESPRFTKDCIEEALFDCRRDLFSEVGLVFFDTTSIYFEGRAGKLLGNMATAKITGPIWLR